MRAAPAQERDGEVRSPIQPLEVPPIESDAHLEELALLLVGIVLWGRLEVHLEQSRLPGVRVPATGLP